MNDRRAVQEQLYTESRAAVRAQGLDLTFATEHYSKYLRFIERHAGHRGGTLLDLGCGNGWSSFLFAQRGYHCTGIDLNARAFEAPPHPHLRLLTGTILRLPFAEDSFDVVASHQTLEHVLDPKLALSEMVRVVKPGGVIGIVSPNLLSALASLRRIVVDAWRNRPLPTIFFRTPDMPRHPWGNTLPELIAGFVRNGLLLAKKIGSRKAEFVMRAPDLRPPFHGDNDACYLCNPVDLLRFFRSQKCTLLKNGFDGRPPLSWLVTTGTYLAVRKGNQLKA